MTIYVTVDMTEYFHAFYICISMKALQILKALLCVSFNIQETYHLTIIKYEVLRRAVVSIEKGEEK